MHIPSQSLAQWGPHHGPMGPDWVARSGLAPWSTAAGTGFELLLPLIWALLLVILLAGLVYLFRTRGEAAHSEQVTTFQRERDLRGVRDSNRTTR